MKKKIRLGLTVKQVREALLDFPDDTLLAIEYNDRFYAVTQLLEVVHTNEEGSEAYAAVTSKLECSCEKCKGSCGPETS